MITPAVTPIVLQVEVTGGSPVMVAVAFALLLAATALSLLVTYRFATGYLRTGTRPFLFLAIGLFLLTAAPILVRLVLVNAADVPAAYRSVITSGSELLGLFVILYTIYR